MQHLSIALFIPTPSPSFPHLLLHSRVRGNPELAEISLASRLRGNEVSALWLKDMSLILAYAGI